MSQKLEVRHTGKRDENTLAVFGGEAVRYRDWPKWPRADARTQRSLLDVLHSTQWTVSGHSDSECTYERRFAQAFADFCRVPYGVSCTNGSAALTIAFQALGIGPGDEVIVPGLTWVACASSICNLGAVPVLADVDQKSLVMTGETARAVASQKTKAILAVHLYSSIAPMGDLIALGEELAVPVVEDASQAHGALFKGMRAGASGIVGVFSMQQSKLLTAGEGGACVTSDPSLYRKLIQLRADSRGYADEEANLVQQTRQSRKLVPYGEVFGRNLCMSEFHAAILLERLPLLDQENTHRHRNFLILAERLKSIEGITLPTGAPSELPTHYRVCVRLAPELLTNIGINTIARCLSAELNLPIEVTDTPLNSSPLYQPMLSPLVSRQPGASLLFEPSRFELPQAMAIASCTLTLPHWCLLGDESDIDDIISAFKKVLGLLPKIQTERLYGATT